MADDLTTTEFAIAMLAARSWTTQEIAKHLNISANTVKDHISEAMRKLGVETRKDLKNICFDRKKGRKEPSYPPRFSG